MLAFVLATLLLQDPQDTGGAPPAPPTTPAPKAAPSPRATPAPRAPTAPMPAPTPRAAPVAPVPPVPPLPVENPRAAKQADVLVGDWPDHPSGKRFNAKEDRTSIDETLQAIADAAGWNISLNTGRTGNKLLVLKMQDVPVEDALRAALRGTGLVAHRSGNIVVVSPPELPLPQAARPVLSGFEKPSGKKFTGEFDGEDVADALRQIAKAGGLSIVIPEGGHGTVTANFVNVPVEDALRAVLSQAGLRGEKSGAVLMIEDAGGDTFDFSVHIPRGLPSDVREAMREARENARQAMRDARQQARDAAREARENSEDDTSAGRDRQSTGSDLTIAPGDRVRDVNVVRGNLVLSGGALARDVAVVQGKVELKGGALARDVVAVLGSVHLDGGANARQVVAVGGDVDVAAGASIENDVISIGGRVNVDPEAEVGGSKRSISFPGLGGLVNLFPVILPGHLSPLWAIIAVLLKFVVLFVLGLLALSLFPRRLDAVTTSMLNAPFKSILVGLLGWLVMPVLGLLLVVTVVGIPLVAVQVLAVIAAVLLGITALVYFVGRMLPLPTQQGPAVGQLAVGVAVFAILTEIPILGFLIWAAVLLITFGAVIRTRFGQSPLSAPPLETTVPPPAGA